uniref:LITAF domain-containing protein n=1 Tax=Parascaris univalens TaxID=6257 RepID=A0A914ZCQ0_PARUN
VGTPPPPYTPQRPPPPYALQNSLLETKENRGRVAPTPFTPFSTTASGASVHPRTVAQPVAIPSQGTGVNPAGAGPTTSNALSYTVKKADTAEPHEEFCPKCQCRIRTRQRFVTGKLTWFLVIVIVIIFFPLAFLPFLIDSCKNVHHHCPKCNMLLSVKKRFFF